MGDEVRVTVIAAGFDRWDNEKRGEGELAGVQAETGRDVFAQDDEIDLTDDDFDVPSFLQ